MANVTSAYRAKDRPQSGRDSWSQSDGISSEYTRSYIATTNSATTDESIILQSSYIPQMFETDSINYNARVVGRNAVRTANPLVWDVEVTYSTNAPNQQDGSGGGGGTTLGGKVVWNIGTEQIQLPMYRDLDDVPVVSSNGLPYASPVMVTRSVLVLRATQAIDFITASMIAAYTNHVNSSSFLGFAEGTVYCRIPSCEPQYQTGVKYYLLQWEFLYDPRGWQPKPLNTGYMYYDNDVSKYATIRDGNGQDVTEPWPLDANGEPLTDAQVQGLTGFTYKEFKGYESADFNALGLGSP